METIGIPLNKLKHLMLLSDRDQALELVTKHMIRTLVGTVSGNKVTVLDPIDIYEEYSNVVNNYVPSSTDYLSIVGQLKEQVQKAKQSGESFEHYILITEMGQFVSESGIEPNDLAVLMEEGQKVGLHFIFSLHKNFITGYSDIPKYLKLQIDAALIAMKMSDHR